MTVSGRDEGNTCHVHGGEKLPAAAGGADAICAAVTRAVAAEAPHARYTVDVTVVRASMLRTALTVGGRTLPEQSFAVMDRDLNPASIDRFAHSIAAAVARASNA